MPLQKLIVQLTMTAKKNHDFQREMAFKRFKLQEDFTLLLNELYPDME